MVIDTSALLAIFFREPEGARFDEAITHAKSRLLPATCIFEARMIFSSADFGTSVRSMISTSGCTRRASPLSPSTPK